MPKCFEGEERAFYEGIVSGQMNVIPDERSLDRGQPDDEADGSEKEITRPLLAAKGGQTRVEVRTSPRASRSLIHEQGCEREAASLNKRASSRFAREDARSLELL